MEIKVNDYVRTKKGYICKIININDFREPSIKYGVEASYLKDIMFIGDEDIIKSSPRIKDLIKVGDYVNGWRVTQITNSYVEICWGRDSDEFIKPENIKSILTKEQFEQMEYKID